MASNITFVVDLDGLGAPKAVVSLRQLLALVDGLPTLGGDLDWRLISLSVNSPLRAELAAFTPDGDDAPKDQVLGALGQVQRLLIAANENDPTKAVAQLEGDDQKRLKAMLQPMKDHVGLVTVSIDDADPLFVRSDQAQAVLAALTPARKGRAPEMGSVEGRILSAVTYFSKPALRVRQFLTGAEVVCVFEREQADALGALHTLQEVWSGKNVMVSGRLTYDATGAVHTVQASDFRVLAPTTNAEDILARFNSSGDTLIRGEWH